MKHQKCCKKFWKQFEKKIRKQTHKFGGAKVCKAEQETKCFENLKIENEVFGQSVNDIISNLHF